MLVLIYDNNRLTKVVVNSNYKYKKIVIFVNRIILNEDYVFSDGTKEKTIEENIYYISTNKGQIELFIYKIFDSNFSLYRNRTFSFGSSENNDIVSNDKYIKDDYFIFKDNIIQTNSKYLYVNNHLYSGEKLKENDRISLLGFEFVYNSNFLYINNCCCSNRLELYEVKQKSIKYEVIKPSYNNYYIDTHNDLVFSKIKEISLPHINKTKNRLSQIGPSLTMSFAMLFLAYINIQKNTGIKTIYDILAIVIMPITMFLSAILWPFIGGIIEKRAYKKEYKVTKKEYISYLNRIQDENDRKIEIYLAKEYDSFFCKNNIFKKLFYIQNNSKCFECISLGLYTKSNNYLYDETIDEEINNKLKNIYDKQNNIYNHPLFLDLKEHRIVTVYTKEKNNILKKYLLELSSKYHYNDVCVVIFDKTKEAYKNMFNIPHNFYNGERLVFSEERDLKTLDNINKETIILSLDRLNINIKSNQKIIYITDQHDIFNNTEAVIEYKDKYGVFNSNKSIVFKYLNEEIDYEKCFEQLSYYYVPSYFNDSPSFNNYYSLIDIENNYLDKQKNLKAEFAISDGEILRFDLHENKDGPHGLIGGSTGSGKSELIVSLLLSLCIRYRPDYLNIILIDYKGGGIASSLTCDNVKIPHIIGEISNLSKGVIERLIYALSFECTKRQEAFKKISEITNASIINIDEYIDAYKESYNVPKIAHLLIVVDEFAELKRSDPEVIKQLISFSRIGRSLGVHLILSTQKPSGIIDEEIWSNSRFKIALKLHDDKDSQDIIKAKDAAYLTKPGEFILQVDNKNIKGDTLYSKKNYLSKKEMRVSLLNDQYKILNTKIEKKEENISEAKVYTSKIIEVTKKLNIKPQTINFEKPKEINRREYNSNSFIFGTVDDYLNAKKYLLNIEFNNNIYIYSLRDNEVNSILNTLNENHIPSIVISHKTYRGKYITDSITYDDEEKINFLFNHSELEESNMYLVIEDFNSFVAYDDKYINYIYKILKRSDTCNLKVILLTKQSVSYFKIINLFKYRLAIGINDQNDLINIFGKKSDYVNDSYFYNGESISIVPCVLESYVESNPTLMPLVEDIPDHILLKETNNNLCIGYDMVYRCYEYVSLSDKSIVITMNDNIYNKLSKIFSNYINIEVIIYNPNINIEAYKNVIWVGSGLFKQRLFISDNKQELRSNEAYIMNEKFGKVVKFIEYE